jgi:hypothetical protein
MSEEALTEVDRLALVNDIATRAGTASEIAKWYDMSRRDLEAFVEVHYPEIVAASNRAAARTPEAETAGTVTPRQLSELWISDKFERLLRYQELAEILYKDCSTGALTGAELATSLREYRSYCTVVANWVSSCTVEPVRLVPETR